MSELSKWVYALPWNIIHDKAEKHRLEPELIAAVIQVESAGNPRAYRHEMGYIWTYHSAALAHELKVPIMFMEYLQKTSWGSMQVMGAVAYERGLSKDFKYALPSILMDSETGIEYGSRHLRWILDHAQPLKVDPDNALDIYAAYNGGSVRKRKDLLYENNENVMRFAKFYRELTDAPGPA